MFTCVIFDLDGTLLNTLQDLAAAGNHTLSSMGLPTHAEVSYRKMVGNGIPKLIQRMLPQKNRGESTSLLAQTLFNKYYSKNIDTFTAPYSGIMQMLHNLKSHGLSLGLLSNKSHEFIPAIVDEYFPSVFNAVSGLREGSPPKPNPASTLFLMDELSASPQTTLFVGDSDVDIFTGKNAGIRSCGVLWGFRDESELQSAGADFLVRDALELEEIILTGQ